MFFRQLELALHSSTRAKAGAALARPALQRRLARFEPSKHNGAPLLGLRGVVVKSHGNASREAMGQAILEALEEAQRRVPRLIALKVQEYL